MDDARLVVPHPLFFFHRHNERTLKMPRGGVNRQSATKNHFKTDRRRLTSETPGISPETLVFVSGVSGTLSQRLRV